MRELVAAQAVVTSIVDEGADRCAGCGNLTSERGSWSLCRLWSPLYWMRELIAFQVVVA